jgi:hypothetical protein
MAVTALIVKDKNVNETKYIQIMTQVAEKPEDGLIVVIRDMDNTFEFVQGSDQGADPRTSEQEYHTELRIMAAEKEQLVTNFSTDPEWNPEGYERVHKPKTEEDGSM